MAQQPSGEFASTDPTKGEEDARVRERRVGAKISLSACSSPQHLQRPTSSSSSLSSLRRSRLRDRGNLRFRSPDRASQPLHQLTRLPNPRRPRQSPLFNLPQRVMNRMFQNAVWPTSRRLELSSRLQRLSVSTAGAPCSRPSISYPSRRLPAESLCQTSRHSAAPLRSSSRAGFPMWQRLWLGFTPEEILRPSPPAQVMSAAPAMAIHGRKAK